MSNVTYDMDTSGGLMPLIRALIKPPDEEPTVPKPKKSQHPYYKRPGKGHNHDSCDACGEGGDLICCDRCPASFHLGCYDPPLDENDIPAGLWLCRECRASDAEKPASSRGSRAQSPADSKSDTEKKIRSLRSRDSIKKRSKEDSSDSEEKEKEKEKEQEKEEKELSPMEILVKAARIMNPTQFELPREMRVPCIFPGTEKEGGGGARVVSLDGAGCVPLPARACFVCRATCRLAPLLQCDYCPLLFHQDCLDPPLTALPTGRWMCPNHVERVIDWKLVNSISLSERVALWERWAGPLDQHTVKIDFIRHARRYRTRLRQKVPLSARGRVRVPSMVKLHYETPAPLLPSRREHVRCNNALKRLQQSGIYTESEDEDAPKHEICLNPDCETEHNAPPAADEPAQAVEEDEKPTPMEKDSDSSSLSDSDFEYVTGPVRRAPAPPPPAPPAATARLQLAEEGRQLLAAIQPQLDRYDEGLLKILAWQRLRQVLAGERCAGAFRQTALPAAARAALRDLPCAGLALTLPSELLSREDRERIACAVWGAPPPPEEPPSPPDSLPDACVRATVCPLSPGAGAGACLRRGSLRIGADSSCELRLPRARCRRLSGLHAVVFMDEVTRHFELINYSEYGTCVNGVVYACDVTQARAPPEPDARAAALRHAVRHRMPEPYRINGSLTAPLAGAGECRCAGARAELTRGAWEGSALLPHGALLQFGCLSYVFSITDTAETDELEPAL